MDLKQLNILLADDDTDDCIFFKKALEELPIPIKLTTVADGEQLMKYLFKHAVEAHDRASHDRATHGCVSLLPDILFLDLNMPRKNGFECLCEIKENKLLKDLPIVMFSTSFPRDPDYERNLINSLLQIGANHFIRKPNDISLLKQTILDAIIMVTNDNSEEQRSK